MAGNAHMRMHIKLRGHKNLIKCHCLLPTEVNHGYNYTIDDIVRTWM